MIRTGLRPDIRNGSATGLRSEHPPRTPTNERTNGLTKKDSPTEPSCDLGNARTRVSGFSRRQPKPLRGRAPSGRSPVEETRAQGRPVEGEL